MFGIAKGGFVAGLGVMAVPVIALVVPPNQGAAILLPILCIMDLVGLWAYRGKWVWPELRILLPASLVGIATGTLIFGYMSPARLRLLLGVVAIAFTLHHWFQAYLSKVTEQKHFGPAVGMAAAAVSGFTSFIAHAGGPPIAMYLLRRGINRTQFVATTVVFFAVVNYIKLVPYAWLGQFDAQQPEDLARSCATRAGRDRHGRMAAQYRDGQVLFPSCLCDVVFVGLKLMYDGVTGV